MSEQIYVKGHYISSYFVYLTVVSVSRDVRRQRTANRRVKNLK
jgi:hypothetical protein